MLLWQFVDSTVQENGLDHDCEKALAWIKERFPSLFHDASGVNFDWSTEWWVWQRNCAALRWLAAKREKAPKPRGRGDRLPAVHIAAIEDVLSGTRNQLPSVYLSECDRLHVVLSRCDGESPLNNAEQLRFDDTCVFWQAVFVSYFDQTAFAPVSVCQRCGDPIPPTKKLKKPSQERFCASCRTKVWRQKNPEHARKLAREQKRRERQS